MKKSYEAPKAEKLEFDYSEVVTACRTTYCAILGAAVYWDDSEGHCESHTPGEE